MRRASPARAGVILTSVLALVLALVASDATPRTASATDVAITPTTAVTTAAPAPAAGWVTLFADDFDGTAGSPVSARWVPELGKWGTGAVDTTTDSTANIFLDGAGNLSIRALQDASGAWTSGRIITADKSFSAPEGGKLLMTASIKLPNPALATGYWPAFWALGLDENGAIDWPRTGEIDMLEAVNGTPQVIQTFHCDLVDGGACNEPYGLTSDLQDCVGCLTEYHTYSAVLDRTVPGADRLEFLVDGGVRYSVKESDVGQPAWDTAIDNNFFLILNLAIGGGLPNGVCGCDSASAPKTSGGTMSVDHVAVYRAEAPTASATSPQDAVTASTPTITGKAAVGATLTANPGVWGPAPVTHTYQWKANGTALTGATKATYTPTSTTIGKSLTVTVTGSKTGYSSSARTSTATAPVAAGTLTAPTPTITGTAKIGSTLTANPGAWGPAPVTLTYQWRANGVAISRAKSATYKPTKTTVGKRITVTVTGSKTGYSRASRTSPATAVVAR